MRKFASFFCVIVFVFSCDPGNFPPADSFQIRFANKGGIEGTQFSIGKSVDDLVCESGPLSVDQITAFLYVAAETYSLWFDIGGGWFLFQPGYSFEIGKKYEYGTDGGASMYVVIVDN